METEIISPVWSVQKGTRQGSPPPSHGMGILQQASLKDNLPEIKAKHKIEYSDLAVSALLLKGEEALKKGDGPSAIATAQKAALLFEESPLPHFFLSHLYRVESKESFLQAIGEYATAIRLSINHFWFATSTIGITSIALMVTLLLCLVTFLLYAVLYYLPLWTHYCQERLPKAIHPYAILLVLAIVLIALLVMLPSFWFLAILLFSFWFFFQRQEKWVAIAFAIGLILSSLLIRPTLMLLTAKQSPLLNQMADNQMGTFGVSSPAVDPSNLDWKADFVQAAYKMQENNLQGAKTSYEKALLKNPDEKGILINLGNIAFYQNKFPDAVSYYKKALAKDPNYVAAHYNLGQVQNEMFAFDKGGEKYREAKKIDQSLAEQYAKWAATYPNHPVIEYRFSEWDIWKQLLFLMIGKPSSEIRSLERVWLGDFSFAVLLIGIAIAFAGIFFISRHFQSHFSESFCPTCGKGICVSCQESFTNYNLCSKCGADMMTGSSKKSRKTPRRLFAFSMLPGGSHLILQRPIVAFGFLIPFYFAVTLMVMGDRFLTASHWHLSIANSPLLPITILFLYGAYLLDLYLRRGK
ncbi:MAG: tetratricopeptide repeat protein [Nitrospirota bacterium]